MIVEEKPWPKRQLQRECKALSDRLLWNSSLDRDVIYHYPIESVEWVALLMTRYHSEAVELILKLPTVDRFFYQTKANRFKQLNIWCVRTESAGELLDRLRDLSGLRVEPLAERVSAHADH